MSEPDHLTCDSNADCESGQRCPYAGSSCIPRDFCDYHFACPVGLHCTSARCQPDECKFETESRDCNGFRCVDGVCRDICYASHDCGAGFHCASSQCVSGAPLANGQACTKAEECNSGTCCAKPSGSVCTSTCAAVPDDSCSVGQDCVSNHCCEQPGGKLACSPVPCTEVPECLTDAHCRFGTVCLDKKCELPLLAGAPCSTGFQCESGSCVAKVCRGTAGEYDDCEVETDCEAGRLCCKSTSDFDEPNYCGKLNWGCAGSIGDVCEFDFECIDDDCNANFTGFCTKPCLSNADCGVSPWGVPNACETNGLGNKICFPGCTSTQQCWDNIQTTFECYDALDSASKICAAG